jgi:hypothetical protein
MRVAKNWGIFIKPGILDLEEYQALRLRIANSFNITPFDLDKMYARACIGSKELYAPGAQWDRAADVKMKPVHWLWPGLIARGKVSIVAGHPGLGKSQWSASLASIITNGGRFPVTRDECELGSVLMLSAEDDPADTAVPRLRAAGADLDHVYILKSIREIDQNNGCACPAPRQSRFGAITARGPLSGSQTLFASYRWVSTEPSTRFCRVSRK